MAVRAQKVNEGELPRGVRQGLAACRRGWWSEGLALLGPVVADENGKGGLPGVVYSYLGYAVAQVEGRQREGLDLCRYAAKIEFYNAENYLNLARVYLLIGNRRQAAKALRKGLSVDPRNSTLWKLYREELGVRRRPVLSSLPRDHAINRALGYLRYHLTKNR